MTQPAAMGPAPTGGFASAGGPRAPLQVRFARAAIGHVADLIGRGTPVVELDAGTGILSGQLLRAGLVPLAVEPSIDGARHIRRTLPAVPVLIGAAGALPLADNATESLVLSCVAGSFDPATHDRTGVVGEAARVLRDHAPLVLLHDGSGRYLDLVERVDRLRDGIERSGDFDQVAVMRFDEPGATGPADGQRITLVLSAHRRTR